MNWYKFAQFISEKAKSKIHPLPEWEREDNRERALRTRDIPEKGSGGFNIERNPDMNYLGYHGMRDEILWFVDSHYQFHETPGDKEDTYSKIHDDWDKFKESEDIVCSGRFGYSSIKPVCAMTCAEPDDRLLEVLGNVFPPETVYYFWDYSYYQNQNNWG